MFKGLTIAALMCPALFFAGVGDGHAQARPEPDQQSFW